MPLVLNGATSGATTLQATDATTQTITLPANSGTVITTASTFAGTGPAFSAYFSGTQNITSNTLTKVTINTEMFDTNGCYDNITNYRFTPNVAGYYQVNASMNGTASGTSAQAVNCELYKNGSPYIANYSFGSYIYPTAVGGGLSTGSAVVYMNGTTDYLEIYGKIVGTSPYISLATFSGSLVRSA